MDIATPSAFDLAFFQTQLNTLGAVVKLAVASYLDMTLAVDGHQVSVTAPEQVTTASLPVGASLLIPLSVISPGQPASTLVLHAATAGAFVDLAADLSYALGLDPLALVLDAHLVPTGGSGQGVSGLGEFSTINRAIGVLLERGHTAESAGEGLARYADLLGGDLCAAAEQVLRSTATALPAVGRTDAAPGAPECQPAELLPHCAPNTPMWG